MPAPLVLLFSGSTACSASRRAESTITSACPCAWRRRPICSRCCERAVAPGPQMHSCQLTSSSCKTRRRARLLATHVLRTACSWPHSASRSVAESATEAARTASCFSTSRDATAARVRTSCRSLAIPACSLAAWCLLASSSADCALPAQRRCSRALAAPRAASAAESSSPAARSCSSSSWRRARAASTAAAARRLSAPAASSSDSVERLLLAMASSRPRTSSEDREATHPSPSARSSASSRKAHSVTAAPQRGGSSSGPAAEPPPRRRHSILEHSDLSSRKWWSCS
mmetsp:Transcript_93203/g.272810  ORF Transcript_93203/g.272810 Transcript_93203/m.272810 type:complete len:286 (-) Transcript_93203:385-1242(-)